MSTSPSVLRQLRPAPRRPRGLWSEAALDQVDALVLAHAGGAPVVARATRPPRLAARLALSAAEAVCGERAVAVPWAAALELVETGDLDAASAASARASVPPSVAGTLRLALVRHVRRTGPGDAAARRRPAGPALAVFGAVVAAGLPADEALAVGRAFDPVAELLTLPAEARAGQLAWERVVALEDAVCDAPALAAHPYLRALAEDLTAAAVAPLAQVCGVR